ncbi:MAG TPA: CBS domain-containing protein [Steroidobacteraceae bacterium]|nr:CBS domain-containing protein [Steroidobacteraceae bacterium]
MKPSIRARDYMVRDIVTFFPDTDVMDAISVLVEHAISGAPVVDTHGNLVGILSEKDCLKVALEAGYYGERAGPVGNYMTPKVETIQADTPIADVARRFADSNRRRLPVMDGTRLVGQISRRDVLRAIRDLG